VKGDSEVWTWIKAYPSTYSVLIVEKKAMRQDVVADATSFANDLRNTGKVAIYGIYFDTGKADLKPESAPALTEIGKLLKQDPALKVYIVGHTDMMGDAAMNLKLSQARAQSVVAELSTRYGVPAARLTPFGAGPYAPVASNDDEDGRAKNRRVELVKR
jgi:OOP family OmpA-OmpF porin